MTEQTMNLWDRESAIKQKHHEILHRRTNRLLILPLVGFVAALGSFKFTTENPYADRPAVLAYSETNNQLFHLKNYQQNTHSIPSLDQLLPEAVTTESSPFHTSLEAHVASLEQTVAILQQHTDVIQYHDQASQNRTNSYFINGAAMVLCLVALVRVFQLDHQKNKAVAKEIAALRASEPSDSALFT